MLTNDVFEGCSVELSSRASDVMIMWTAADLAFLAGGGPEEEEAPPFLDQRFAFFFTSLNLRRCLKLSEQLASS